MTELILCILFSKQFMLHKWHLITMFTVIQSNYNTSQRLLHYIPDQLKCRPKGNFFITTQHYYILFTMAASGGGHIWDRICLTYCHRHFNWERWPQSLSPFTPLMTNIHERNLIISKKNIYVCYYLMCDCQRYYKRKKGDKWPLETNRMPEEISAGNCK